MSKQYRIYWQGANGKSYSSRITFSHADAQAEMRRMQREYPRLTVWIEEEA